MSEKQEWYEIVDDDKNVFQGDFLNSCPVIIPQEKLEESKSITAKVDLYNVIVMSQSCDLLQRKLKLVLVCPCWSINKFSEKENYYGSSEGKNQLRKGYSVGYHLLNNCDIEKYENDYLVVDFRETYSLPIDFIFAFIKEQKIRKRLISPYREHLSQAFARFFMRVGLPSDIPEFKDQ